MQMAVNQSNNNEVLGGMFEHTLSAYLQKDESKEDLLKKFNGNKIELIKFLRDRDYAEWIKANKKPADTSDINNKLNDLKKKHDQEVIDGSLRLYDTPRREEKATDSVPPLQPFKPTKTTSKSKSSQVKPIEPEAPKVEVKEEKKPTVRYVEEPVVKKKWAKTKEKPESDKSQSSLF